MKAVDVANHPEKATKKELVKFVKNLSKGKILVEDTPDRLADLSKEELIQILRIKNNQCEAQKVIIMHAYSDLDDFLNRLEDLEPDEDEIPKAKKSVEGYS